MNQKMTDELNEIIRLITIEKKLGKMDITLEEVVFIFKLANEKHYPRAEYVLAMMYFKGLCVTKNRILGNEYLEKCSKHASYDIQLKIAYVYHVMGDFKKTINCLKRAIVDCEYLV